MYYLKYYFEVIRSIREVFGSFGGDFTKPLTDVVIDILNDATHITDFALAYVRILCMEERALLPQNT